MSERPEPFLFERVWAHPSSEVTGDVPAATPVFDDGGRLVGVRYEDGEGESYEYDEAGRLVAIQESPAVYYASGYPGQRVDTGGRLSVDHDDQGPLRIVDEHDRTVWERP